MRIEPILLARGAGGKRKARWRAMTGADELALFGCDYAGAIEWLASMLADGEEWIGGTDVPQLDLDDTDRLFEAVYRALFGPTVELRHRCGACGEGYELALTLDDLFPVAEAGPREEARVELPGGTSVRALRTSDLLSAGSDEAALVAGAIIERGSDDEAAIAAAVESLSPSRVETVETVCAQCKRPQVFPFDLSAFLLACCVRERPILLREIHLLARSYGWSFADIISLDRKARHELVRLIITANAARPRGRAA